MASFNGASEGSSDDMDGELSPELSAQLGDLLLDAAQQFNIDNPNVGLNFMQVFGGDEDFGFNPGDEDMMDYLEGDSDSDSYFEDIDDSVQQIFTSLADSHILKRLSYHKNIEPFQLPRVSKDVDICYEQLYR